MTRRRLWAVCATAVILVILGAIVRNQIKVYRGRQTRLALMQQRHPVVPLPREVTEERRELFDLLRPVAIQNCELERFGERNDGGYLMCANLLGAVRSGYSYGIAGYDQWGCDVSTKLDVSVHQYDCFDTTRTSCRGGKMRFHEECVGAASRSVEGRVFDTIANQFGKNGDRANRVVMKIDVESAEWDSFLAVPDDVFGQIDQMAVEFHWEEDAAGRWIRAEKYLRVVRRLKQFFEVGHIHFNNASCIGDLAPFPSFAFEVLFVSKRLAVVDPSRSAGGVHPLDALNNPWLPECQPKTR